MEYSLISLLVLLVKDGAIWPVAYAAPASAIGFSASILLTSALISALMLLPVRFYSFSVFFLLTALSSSLFMASIFCCTMIDPLSYNKFDISINYQ